MFLKLVLLLVSALFALAQRSISPDVDAENMYLRHCPEQTTLDKSPIRPCMSFHVLFGFHVLFVREIGAHTNSFAGSLDGELGYNPLLPWRRGRHLDWIYSQISRNRTLFT